MTARKVETYDFKRADRISKHEMRSLNFIHDKFARNLSSSVSAYLRTIVEVNLQEIVQVSYGEFLNSVADPTCYAAISLKPLDGLGALELEPTLVFPILDRLLGGEGRPMAMCRPMTEIERKIIQGFLKLILDNLCESWKQVYPLEFAVASTETNPHMVQITAPNEPVVKVEFQFRIRDLMAKLRLAIPTILLDPIVHIFDQEEYTTRKVIRDGTIAHLVRQIPVNVAITTCESSFPMRSLVSLRIGDTVVLDQRQDAPVVLKIAGKNKLYAKTMPNVPQKAFVVTGSVRPRKEGSLNGPAAEQA